MEDFQWFPAFLGVLISVGVSSLIAIFGDDIRAFFRNPKLELTLPDLEGEWTVLRGGKHSPNPAIYFHALIENSKPIRLAQNVELFIKNCVVVDGGGRRSPQPMPCPLPIQARRKFEGKRHGMIDIGATPFAYDLIRCRKSGTIEILLNCDYPNNFKPSLNGPGMIELEIQALGTNCVSDKLVITVEWDGIFPIERDGLGDHIKISQTHDCL